MTLTLGQLEKATDRAAKRRKSIAVRLLGLVRPIWRNFNGWYDNDLVVANAARTADLVESAWEAQARNAQAFARALLRLQDVEPATDLLELDYGRTVRPLEAYARPAVQYRYSRSQDGIDELALEAAIDRLEHLANFDLADAGRRGTAQVSETTPEVIGQRRIIHPELSKGGTCGLCIAASTQIYHPGKILPIHDGCNCEAVPIVEGQPDQASQFNAADLKRLYEEAGSTSSADLKRTRYRVSDDGELETLLMPSGAKHRGVEGRSATGADTPIKDIESEIRVLEESLERLRERASWGEDVAEPIRYQENRVKKLQKQKNPSTPDPDSGAATGGGHGSGGGSKTPPRSPEPGDDDWQPRDRQKVSVKRFIGQRGFENVDFSDVDVVYEHEAYTAKRLTRSGHHVKFRPESEEGRNPDVILDATKVAEFKAPTGAGKRNIEYRIKDASRQARFVVIDLFRSPKSLDEAIADARSGLRQKPNIMEVIIIDKNGDEHGVRRE